MPWIMDAQSWKIIWGQSLMSRWVANHANSLRFPVPWKQACVLCFWFSFFWPCFPDLPSASGAVDIWCTGHLLCLADFGRLFDHRNYFIHDNMIPDTTFAKDRFFLQQWSRERPLFQRKKTFCLCEANHFRMFLSQFSQVEKSCFMQNFSLMKRLTAAMASAGDFFGESVKSGKGWHIYWNSFDSSSLSMSGAVWMIGLTGSSLNFCEAIAHLVKSRQMERKSESHRRLRSEYVVLQKPRKPGGG